MLNSDDLIAFLALRRTGNTLAAAKRLGVDHSTISRRLAALEKMLGVRLFDRSPRGMAPTEAADLLLGHAERVERELISAASSVKGKAEATGIVRLATPEVFGTCLVAPRMADFRESFPGLTLELVPESRSVSLSKREADIAIMLRSPPRGRLTVRKLTDYTIGLYAARTHFDVHSQISAPPDLRDQNFVSYVDELLDYPEMNVLTTVVPGVSPVFKSSSSAAQQAAIAAGIGLGMLHRFAADRDARLQRVLPDHVEVTRSYWVVMHTDDKHDPRIRAVLDFLGDIVAGARDYF